MFMLYAILPTKGFATFCEPEILKMKFPLYCFSVLQVGFKTIRFYWSMRTVNRRCKYHCVVDELEGTPSFTIRVDEEGQSQQLVFRGKTPRGELCLYLIEK